MEDPEKKDHKQIIMRRPLHLQVVGNKGLYHIGSIFRSSHEEPPSQADDFLDDLKLRGIPAFKSEPHSKLPLNPITWWDYHYYCY